MFSFSLVSNAAQGGAKSRPDEASRGISEFKWHGISVMLSIITFRKKQFMNSSICSLSFFQPCSRIKFHQRPDPNGILYHLKLENEILKSHPPIISSCLDALQAAQTLISITTAFPTIPLFITYSLWDCDHDHEVHHCYSVE